MPPRVPNSGRTRKFGMHEGVAESPSTARKNLGSAAPVCTMCIVLTTID